MALQLALIGTGGIAGRHATVLQRIQDARVAVVCDIDRHKAEAFNRQHELGTAVYESPEDALAHPGIGGVILLTPRTVREPILDLCLQRDLPVMLEKPPCHDLPTGQRIEEKLRQAGLIHSVAFPTRYNQGLEDALSRLRGQTLSALQVIMETPMATNPSYGDPYLVERSGGLVGDQGIHYIDIARYITASEAQQVFALGSNRVLPRGEKVTTCDTAGWVIRMHNGMIVTHTHVWGAWRWKVEFRLVTDRSTVFVDGLTGGARGSIDGQEYEFHPQEETVLGSFELENRAFIQAVLENDPAPIRCDYADALKSFALAEEILTCIENPTGEDR